MPTDLPYLIALAGAAVLVILYVALRSWSLGLFHPVISVLSLVCGLAAGLFTFRRAGPLFEAMNVVLTPHTLMGIGALAGILVIVFLRKTGHKFLEDACSGEIAARIFTGPGGAILGLLPAVLFLAVLAVALRHHATFAELSHIDECSALYARGATEYPETSYAIALRDALEGVPRAAELLDRASPYGFFGPAAPRHLVGLALISRNYDLYLALGRDPAVLEIYAHPRVTALLADLPVTQLLDRKEHLLLLANESVLETAALPGLSGKLARIDVLGTLHRILE